MAPDGLRGNPDVEEEEDAGGRVDCLQESPVVADLQKKINVIEKKSGPSLFLDLLFRISRSRGATEQEQQKKANFELNICCVVKFTRQTEG